MENNKSYDVTIPLEMYEELLGYSTRIDVLISCIEKNIDVTIQEVLVILGCPSLADAVDKKFEARREETRKWFEEREKEKANEDTESTP